MPIPLDISTYNAGFPVFCIGATHSKDVVIGGGGGPGSTGVSNRLVVLKLSIEERMLEKKTVLLLDSAEDAPTCLAISPKGDTVVCGINSSNEAIKAGKNENFRVFDFAKSEISPGTTKVKTVASTDPNDYQVSVLDFPTLKPRFKPMKAPDEVFSIAFSTDDKQVAVLLRRQLRILNAKDGTTLKTINPVVKPNNDAIEFRSCCYAKDRGAPVLLTALNASSQKHSYIVKWDIKSWEKLLQHKVASSPITAFCVSRDGKLIAFATKSMNVVVCSTATLKTLIIAHNVHNFPITCITFDAETKFVITGSADETCKLIRLPDRWPNIIDHCRYF
ncbi:hypothetical protein EV182_002944, partial [Spiromyces aspiralis]